MPPQPISEIEQLRAELAGEIAKWSEELQMHPQQLAPGNGQIFEGLNNFDFFIQFLLERLEIPLVDFQAYALRKMIDKLADMRGQIKPQLEAQKARSQIVVPGTPPVASLVDANGRPIGL